MADELPEDKIKKTKVDKAIKKSKRVYKIIDKEATKAHVKANKTDASGNFYVFDLYDESGALIALNRYVYKDSLKQPFETLTVEEELILNPPYVEPEPMGMI